MSCRPHSKGLGLPHLRAWFTFLYRVTGLRAVEVIGLRLTDSRGSHLFGFALPSLTVIIISQLVFIVNTFFKVFLKNFEEGEFFCLLGGSALHPRLETGVPLRLGRTAFRSPHCIYITTYENRIQLAKCTNFRKNWVPFLCKMRGGRPPRAALKKTDYSVSSGLIT